MSLPFFSLQSFLITLADARRKIINVQINRHINRQIQPGFTHGGARPHFVTGCIRPRFLGRYLVQKNFPLCSPSHRNLDLQRPRLRLGCRSTGFYEIMKHPFFKGIDWESFGKYVSSRSETPPSPRRLTYFLGKRARVINLPSIFQRKACNGAKSSQGSTIHMRKQ